MYVGTQLSSTFTGLVLFCSLLTKFLFSRNSINLKQKRQRWICRNPTSHPQATPTTLFSLDRPVNASRRRCCHAYRSPTFCSSFFYFKNVFTLHPLHSATYLCSLSCKCNAILIFFLTRNIDEPFVDNDIDFLFTPLDLIC